MDFTCSPWVYWASYMLGLWTGVGIMIFVSGMIDRRRTPDMK